MITSYKGLNLIKKWEGIHDGDLKQIGLQPKMDPVGIWTEGYGRAMRKPDGNFAKDIKDKKWAYDNITISSEKEAEEALKVDIRPVERLVISKIKVPLNQNQFDALVTLFYNIGFSTTLTKLINSKASKSTIYDWWTTHYVTGQGNPKPLPGLVERRKEEATLFFS